MPQQHIYSTMIPLYRCAGDLRPKSVIVTQASAVIFVTYLERMSLGIEHPFVHAVRLDLPWRVVCMDEIAILEHFSKEEGVLEVGEVSPTWCVHVRDFRVAGADACGGIDGFEAIPGVL